MFSILLTHTALNINFLNAVTKRWIISVVLWIISILLTRTNVAQNEVALSYHRVRSLYFLAVIFAVTLRLWII